MRYFVRKKSYSLEMMESLGLITFTAAINVGNSYWSPKIFDAKSYSNVMIHHYKAAISAGTEHLNVFVKPVTGHQWRMMLALGYVAAMYVTAASRQTNLNKHHCNHIRFQNAHFTRLQSTSVVLMSKQIVATNMCYKYKTFLQDISCLSRPLQGSK